MENKTAEEILRDLIDKHLEFKSGLETTSIQYYAEYGKVSGSMYLNVKRLCEEYASQQLAEKDKEIDRLKKSLEGLLDGIDTFCKTIPAQMTSEAIYLWEKRTSAHESLNK